MADTALAAEIVIYAAEVANPRFTPRELREIREHLGRSFSQVMAEDDTDDKFVVFAWLKLRRDGHPVDWAALDDVVISLVAGEAPVDPTNGQRPATSPRSVATGG